jgi:hypothetical protein
MGYRRRKDTINKSMGVVVEERTRNRRHCHYWIIESPRGPTSRGICKFCGSTREFDNFGPDFRWYGDTPELLVPSLPEISADKEKK